MERLTHTGQQATKEQPFPLPLSSPQTKSLLLLLAWGSYKESGGKPKGKRRWVASRNFPTGAGRGNVFPVTRLLVATSRDCDSTLSMALFRLCLFKQLF